MSIQSFFDFLVHVDTVLNETGVKITTELGRIAQLALGQLPYWEKSIIGNSLFLLDIFFAPKQLIKQFILIISIQSALLVGSGFGNIYEFFMQVLTTNGRRHKTLADNMKKARSFTEWKKFAEEDDMLNGYDKWRKEEDSTFYDANVLRYRIRDLCDLMGQKKVFDLMFRIRGGLARDQNGMQHEGLYTLCKAGTKHIIEDYQDTVVNALNMICDAEDASEAIPLEAKLAFFNETRHAYGRTALLLSGGAALGFYHVGVVKGLNEEGLLPKIISGASAGSVVAAVIATRREDELLEILDKCNFRSDFFVFGWDKSESIVFRFLFFLPSNIRWIGDLLLGVLVNRQKLLKLDTDHLQKVVLANVGHYTFQEAFDRTGRILNITVAPLNKFDPPRLLNYLTAPHVCVWSAAAASCAIPGVFESIQLIVKEPNGEYRPEHAWTLHGSSNGSEKVKGEAPSARYSDGSIENDLPMQQLSEMFNVNHFIVSQANPHSTILSSLAVRATVWSPPIFGLVVGYLRFLKAQFRDWLKNVIDLIAFRSMAPSWGARRGLVQIITQEYEGRPIDITIQPWQGHVSPMSALFRLIVNVTNDEFREIVNAGFNNTFPFIPRIKAQCLVEQTLDQCVQRLRERLMRVSGDLIESKPGNFDRLPSFYVNPSVANLHDLSVGDTLRDKHLLESEPVIPTRSSFSSVNSDLSYHHEGEYSLLNQPVNDQVLEDSDSPCKLKRFNEFGNSTDSLVNFEQLHDSGDGGSRRSSRRISPGKDTASVELSGSRDSSSAPSPAKTSLKRNPSMADFYYKHALASDQNI